jgi:hypothetical protein
MFQRVVTGEVSPFLAGLGHHLTDISPVEILTLAPLGTLVVVFGLFPGILLSLVGGTVDASLGDAGAGSAIAIDPLVVAIGLGLVAAAVVVRVATLPGGAGSGSATPATAATTATQAASSTAAESGS